MTAPPPRGPAANRTARAGRTGRAARTAAACDAPVLGEPELNRAMLARQWLLARASTTVPAALEAMGGLQAQYAPSMYVGLWSRLTGLDRAEVTRALEDRTVVQGTLQRSTIHLVSAGDYWPFALAVRAARRQWFHRVRPDAGEADLAAAADRLRSRLAVTGRVDRRELERVVGKDNVLGIGLWVDLVRVPPSGTWERRRADLFALAEDWIGPPTVDEDTAVEHVVRRYLGAFGPGARKDVAGWAGVPVGALTAALDRVALRRFRDAAGRELVDLPDAPLPDPDVPAPVRFLPTYDAVLLAHARGGGILPERHRPLVFTSRNPQSVGTFTVDGRVAGSWRHDGARVTVEPYEPLARRDRAEVDAEAERLTAFHA